MNPSNGRKGNMAQVSEIKFRNGRAFQHPSSVSAIYHINRLNKNTYARINRR